MSEEATEESDILVDGDHWVLTTGRLLQREDGEPEHSFKTRCVFIQVQIDRRERMGFGVLLKLLENHGRHFFDSNTPTGEEVSTMIEFALLVADLYIHRIDEGGPIQTNKPPEPAGSA
jgi:hypothetical protein